MKIHDLTRSLHTDNGSKIVMVVSATDWAGCRWSQAGRRSWRAAATPNMDDLVAKNVCGFPSRCCRESLPGSGPGHLGLFGYDPLEYTIGRGVLEALGIDIELGPGDVAARGNFCTVDDEGKITDRRAGRIPTETCIRLVEKLRKIRIDGVELIVEPVREYRFAVIFRGQGLEGEVDDTRPPGHRRSDAGSAGQKCRIGENRGDCRPIHRAGKADSA